jgi:hypothetical protein
LQGRKATTRPWRVLPKPGKIKVVIVHPVF